MRFIWISKGFGDGSIRGAEGAVRSEIATHRTRAKAERHYALTHCTGPASPVPVTTDIIESPSGHFPTTTRPHSAPHRVCGRAARRATAARDRVGPADGRRGPGILRTVNRRRGRRPRVWRRRKRDVPSWYSLRVV